MGIVASLIALIGLLAALGQVGYLALLSNAAGKRGAAGSEIAEHAKGRWPVAGGAAVVALVGLLLAAGTDGVALDIIGLLLGAGGGIVGWRGLQQLRSRYPTP